MSVRSRLKRLETALDCRSPYLSAWDLLFFAAAVPEDFDPAGDLDPRHLTMWHAAVTLPNWLEEKGYANALDALKAGEAGPEGLTDLLREQAGYEEQHRAWKRLEDGLDPTNSDPRLFMTDG